MREELAFTGESLAMMRGGVDYNFFSNQTENLTDLSILCLDVFVSFKH